MKTIFYRKLQSCDSNTMHYCNALLDDVITGLYGHRQHMFTYAFSLRVSLPGGKGDEQ